ncbi:MAG: ABC transporter ATP-binding protein [Rhodobacteraceae bacterium]|nr:ABC transporter ATP-binding protein [Paracoccaceae bacterium]
MSDTIISLRSISKRYGAVLALDDVSAEIVRGEFFSLLGPSGCGKTTLLRAIAGFEEPDAGVLQIDGQNMAEVPANRRPTNMVFQSYAIFPHLSVGENVAFGLRRRGLSRAETARKVGAALEMVGLAGLEARASHALSGGQRQRGALARALILEPKVLLLDEPLSALDKKMRNQMQEELRRLQRHGGITFILRTHDQEEALIMSDRIAVMFDGRIAQIATPQTLYRRPSTRRVADFIGSMNFVPARVVSEQGAAYELEVTGFGRAPISHEQAPEGVSGRNGVVGIRPETLTILFGAEAAGPHVVTGVVDDLVYYGDMTYYDVRLPGHEEALRISMRNTAGRRVLERGAEARVAWSPETFVYFP